MIFYDNTTNLITIHIDQLQIFKHKWNSNKLDIHSFLKLSTTKCVITITFQTRRGNFSYFNHYKF